ncbi:MAG: amino acid ABC transporter permease [Candidatus Rokuibacteriota bacterium]|nr:MAG: amino acid ABC transporter permease [Candidatus Rokubacteria bacterium]
MTFRLDVIVKELPQFARGLGNTVWLCVVSMLLSLLLGILFVVPLMSRRRSVRGVARALVDVGRCIPFLLLTYLVYYALPSLGLSLDKWTAALITLVTYNTAYMAEILRAAWAHLPRGQTEAGRAFGYTGIKLFRRIILAQVLIAVGPVVGNQLIQLIKDSAFLSIITVPELTYAANSVQSFYFVPFESFLVATLLYWGLCGGVEYLVRRGERLAAVVRRGHGH